MRAQSPAPGDPRDDLSDSLKELFAGSYSLPHLIDHSQHSRRYLPGAAFHWWATGMVGRARGSERSALLPHGTQEQEAKESTCPISQPLSASHTQVTFHSW